MKALVFDRIGLPEEVLELREVPAPEIRRGEVRVRMVSASINPGDSLFIQNLYPEPRKPVLPQQIAGNHGAGIVMGAGEGVSPEPGTLVAFSYYNTWAEYAAVPAEWLIPLAQRLSAGEGGPTAEPGLQRGTCWRTRNVQPGQWVAGHRAATFCSNDTAVCAAPRRQRHTAEAPIAWRFFATRSDHGFEQRAGSSRRDRLRRWPVAAVISWSVWSPVVK